MHMKARYQELAAGYGLLTDVEKPERESQNFSSPPMNRYQSYPFVCGATLLFASLALIATLLHKPSDAQCARQLSVWSPALEAIEYVEFDLVNDFEQPSKFRGPPTKEIEDAWAELWDVGGVRIPPEKMYLINRTEDERDWRRVPPEAGPGYVALLDVFHQIHCLDLIRKFTWLQAGHYSPIGQGTETNPEIPNNLDVSDVGQRMHVDHCIETLRKTIMCHGDVTPFLAVNDPKSPVGHKADFSFHQKCRDFGRIRKWMGENFAMQ